MQVAQTSLQSKISGSPLDDKRSSQAENGVLPQSDFQTFLRMLTVQIQNQDPLNPMQSSEFAVQLATFSGVEQQVQTNKLLSELGDRFGLGTLAQLSGWVGREVRAPTHAAFDGTPIELYLGDVSAEGESRLSVRNALGDVVQRIPLTPGETTFTWAGKDAQGQQMLPGDYSFDVEIMNGSNVVGTHPAEVYSVAAEVRMDNGAASVVLRNGDVVPAEKITGIRG